MDETIDGIINTVTIRYPKPTKIKGGHLCSIFYDCAKLSPNDLARLGAQTTGHLDEDNFNAVLGISYSGILFAAAIAGGRQVNILQKDGEIYGPSLKGKMVLIVDDVVASGAQMKDAATRAEKQGAKVIGFACIVDRTGGKFAADSTLPLLSAHQSEL